MKRITIAAVLLTLLGCISVYAQDSGMWAAQQANQQAMQAAQQASQQATQDAQQANQQAMQNTGPVSGHTRQPVFSVKPGTVKPGTRVRIKCRTHYAAIYYTTNGWTPTVHSRRYTGPIVVSTTTDLQAIAIAPKMGRSLIAGANYTVPGSAPTIEPLVLPADGLLAAGTRLHLATHATVDSKTAQIGDPIGIVLDQDIKAGATVLARKGTPIQATITLADHAGHAGTPGDLAFEVHFLTIHGTAVPLEGGETLEGANHYARTRRLFLIPVVGLSALAIHGDEAQIQPGMTFTAVVAKDTHLEPQPTGAHVSRSTSSSLTSCLCHH